MAFNGAGVFARLYNWITDRDNAVKINATRMDAEMDGFATGLSTCITKDGQTTITANLPMSTYRHTGVGNASARTDYAATGQVQDSSFIWAGTGGGTADVITLTLTPAITAYATGQTFFFKAGGTNTTNVTVNVNALGAKAITKNGAVALAAGDIQSGATYGITYDGTQFQLIPSLTGGKQTIFIPAGAMRPSSAGGCAALTTIATTSNRPDVSSLNFDASTQEYAQFCVAMPKSWNEGTVTAQFYWSHASTTTNFGVVWDIQAVAVSNDDTIDVAFGTAQQIADTGGTTDDLYVSSETPAITVGGTPAEGDLTAFRISRVTGDGSDTMAIDARLMGIAIYFTTNTMFDN